MVAAKSSGTTLVVSRMDLLVRPMAELVNIKKTMDLKKTSMLTSVPAIKIITREQTV